MLQSGFDKGLAVTMVVLMVSFEGEAVGCGDLPFPNLPFPHHHGPDPWAVHPMKSLCEDRSKCNERWQEVLLNEMMNLDDWKCGNRTAADGTVENCVLTGSYPNSCTATKPAVVTTGCGWVMPLFCDDSVNDIVNSLKSVNPETSVVPATPSGYTLVPGSGFYKVHTEERTFAAAQNLCLAEGGHLAVPSTPNDYTEIMKLLVAAGIPPKESYVGLNDIANEGTFVSVTGQPSCQLAKIPYINGKPNNYNGDEDCLVFGSSNKATVNDIICSEVNAFVCQIILPSRLAPCRQ